MRLSWVRRTRLGGDDWAGEPPLGAGRERYQVEVLDGSHVVRVQEVSEPTTLYPGEAVAADFPSGLPNPISVRVRQWSDAFGWGKGTLRELWL